MLGISLGLGILGSILGGASAASQASNVNEQIAKQSQTLNQQYALQKQLLEKQIEQQRQIFRQQIDERRIQGFKAVGGQTAWAAATGLQGASVLRLLQSTKADTSKDIGVIETNLNNYLAQAKIQQQVLEQEHQAAINQLEAQKLNPNQAFVTGAFQGFSGGYNFGSNVAPGVLKLFGLS